MDGGVEGLSLLYLDIASHWVVVADVYCIALGTFLAKNEKNSKYFTQYKIKVSSSGYFNITSWTKNEILINIYMILVNLISTFSLLGWSMLISMSS